MSTLGLPTAQYSVMVSSINLAQAVFVGTGGSKEFGLRVEPSVRFEWFGDRLKLR